MKNRATHALKRTSVVENSCNLYDNNHDGFSHIQWCWFKRTHIWNIHVNNDKTALETSLDNVYCSVKIKIHSLSYFKNIKITLMQQTKQCRQERTIPHLATLLCLDGVTVTLMPSFDDGPYETRNRHKYYNRRRFFKAFSSLFYYSTHQGRYLTTQNVYLRSQPRRPGGREARQ